MIFIYFFRQDVIYSLINFAFTLRELRTKRGISQSDLARLLGVARTTVSSYENGSRKPDNETLVLIANCFQVSTDYLLGIEANLGSISEYSIILKEINNLLQSASISMEKKREILEEVESYFRWKLDQAEKNHLYDKDK